MRANYGCSTKETPFSLFLQYFSPFVHALPHIACLLTAISLRNSWADELLEAGRIDGAGEFRIFTTITLRLLTPALVTILLFGFVGIWTNFFLPLIMFSDPGLFPITVGLQSWNVTASNAGANTQTIYNLIVTGALVSSIPLLIGCIILQRFWRGGLGAGSVKG